MTSTVFPRTVNRRQVLRAGAAGAAAAALAPAASWASGPALRDAPGTVVRVHLPGMRTGIHPHPQAAELLVKKALLAFTGESTIPRAWAHFVRPDMRIGIKVNCLGTRMVSSQREITYAVVRSLNEAGVPNENILIFDMFASNMMGGRYDQQKNPAKVRVLAHRNYSYSPKVYTAGPARARFSNLFLECDAVINLPPIKDHDLVGVTCCMKNITFGTVEKPHINHAHCNEAIARLWALDAVRRRVVLHIVDGSTILYDGGPKFKPGALVPHESLYITTDPVAMDRIAHDLIADLRRQKGLPTLEQAGRPARYLDMAASLGLGIARRDAIALHTITLPPFAAPSS